MEQKLQNKYTYLKIKIILRGHCTKFSISIINLFELDISLFFFSRKSKSCTRLEERREDGRSFFHFPLFLSTNRNECSNYRCRFELFSKENLQITVIKSFERGKGFRIAGMRNERNERGARRIGSSSITWRRSVANNRDIRDNIIIKFQKRFENRKLYNLAKFW